MCAAFGRDRLRAAAEERGDERIHVVEIDHAERGGEVCRCIAGDERTDEGIDIAQIEYAEGGGEVAGVAADVA